jgi:hypothetical protein
MDHLVFGVPDLARGIEFVEHKTGVRARFGGQHPGRGTHNALLSLGGRQYLEIIAIDPVQTEAPGLLFPELKSLSQPQLIAWAVAVESVVDTAKRAKAENIETVGPLAGSRAQADGSLLTWKTLRLAGARAAGLPFFSSGSKARPILRSSRLRAACWHHSRSNTRMRNGCGARSTALAPPPRSCQARVSG